MEDLTARIRTISGKTYQLHVQWRASLKRCAYFLIFFAGFSVYNKFKKVGSLDPYSLPVIVNVVNCVVGLSLLGFFQVPSVSLLCWYFGSFLAIAQVLFSTYQYLEDGKSGVIWPMGALYWFFVSLMLWYMRRSEMKLLEGEEKLERIREPKKNTKQD